MKLLQHLARQVIRAQVHGATPGRLVDRTTSSSAGRGVASARRQRRRGPRVTAQRLVQPSRSSAVSETAAMCAAIAVAAASASPARIASAT
ncbi:MAG: hypothetical protein JWP64_5597, partial [Pseudonocardia sp.]|nr:hypothetical protein [Pseudonocardia sp.]